MAIAYVALGTRVDIGTGTATLPYPAGIVSGDTLVACCHKKPGTAVVTPPSNTLTWTDADIHTLGVAFHKIYTATYDGLATAPTLDSGSDPTYGRMFALRCSNAIVVDNFDAGSATQTNLRYPALSLANDNEFVLTYCRSNGALTSVTPDAGFTEIEDFSLTAAPAGVHLQYQIQTARTNILQGNPATVGMASVAVRGITIAFTEGPPTPANARPLMLGVG